MLLFPIRPNRPVMCFVVLCGRRPLVVRIRETRARIETPESRTRGAALSIMRPDADFSPKRRRDDRRGPGRGSNMAAMRRSRDRGISRGLCDSAMTVSGCIVPARRRVGGYLSMRREPLSRSRAGGPARRTWPRKGRIAAGCGEFAAAQA
jgi:hypothetical protein